MEYELELRLVAVETEAEEARRKEPPIHVLFPGWEGDAEALEELLVEYDVFTR